jgi:hypothetical protein
VRFDELKSAQIDPPRFHAPKLACFGMCRDVTHEQPKDPTRFHDRKLACFGTCRDVTGLDFWAACGGCGGEAKLKGVGRGSRAECTCRGCFSGMHFGFGGLRVAAVGNAGSSGGGGKGGGEGGKKGGGKEQALNLVVGTPLPDKGACKHFKRFCPNH